MKVGAAPLLVFIIAALFPTIASAGEAAAVAAEAMPPYWTVAPFILMLAGIAVIPLVAAHWWEKNKNKAILSAALGAVILVYLLFLGPPESKEKMAITMMDYVAFISLLASLFIIAGGIYVRGTLAGTPVVNTLMLLVGAVLASFMGTTGAAMLLVRPMIRANSWRKSRFLQIVFLIFLVANIGGLLTPLGDPPLFLGFLKRVPFQWTFQLWPEWLFTVAAVLATFFAFDVIMVKRELKGGAQPPAGEKDPLRLEGWHNFIFLALIIGVILFAGYVSQNGMVTAWTGMTHHLGIDAVEKIGQSILMLIVAGIAYKVTKAETRYANNFGWAPILEVAILFIGIFVTMIPALWILDVLGSRNELGIDKPWQFFWATGGLSSFLDNAPTYLTFSAAASGLNHTDPNNLMELIKAVKTGTHMHFDGVMYLKAVSTGAVFMGANTYIGNGPNFMVKAIAEENGVKMPSFFGYMFYSVVILVPTFILVTLIFLTGHIL
jgi:Na+/H+ antiporter NhaD/arsenite permease-like protein